MADTPPEQPRLSRLDEWVRTLPGRYEAWYGRRLDRYPVGTVKTYSVPRGGLTGPTLSGVLFTMHKSALARHGWERFEVVEIRGTTSGTLWRYRKMREPRADEREV